MPHNVFQRQSVPLSVKCRARLMGNKTKQVGRRRLWGFLWPFVSWPLPWGKGELLEGPSCTENKASYWELLSGLQLWPATNTPLVTLDRHVSLSIFKGLNYKMWQVRLRAQSSAQSGWVPEVPPTLKDVVIWITLPCDMWPLGGQRGEGGDFWVGALTRGGRPPLPVSTRECWSEKGGSRPVFPLF